MIYIIQRQSRRSNFSFRPLLSFPPCRSRNHSLAGWPYIACCQRHLFHCPDPSPTSILEAQRPPLPPSPRPSRPTGTCLLWISLQPGFTPTSSSSRVCPKMVAPVGQTARTWLYITWPFTFACPCPPDSLHASPAQGAAVLHLSVRHPNPLLLRRLRSLRRVRCDGPVLGFGLCSLHYLGDPLHDSRYLPPGMSSVSPPVPQRL